MSDDTCSLCGEPLKSFIGSEENPILKLCWDHDEKFKKANIQQRGRMIAKAEASS